ncbi:hypothetical protein SKA58_01270 [Sphingomonas sp. SKA58]|nr:hypothetical protein SKA58_01270 [Sphingomonas sp. SKA58]
MVLEPAVDRPIIVGLLETAESTSGLALAGLRSLWSLENSDGPPP